MLSSKNPGKGKFQEREVAVSGRASAWAPRHPERQLKALTSIRSVPLLAMHLSEAGTCRSAKMTRTIIVGRNYLHRVKKYQRYEKRLSNIAAHISTCFRVKEGDHIIIGQCRPLSKTVRFNVLKVIPAGSSGGRKKAFAGM